MEKIIKILEAILLLKDRETQFKIMIDLGLSAKDILFAQKILNELNEYLDVNKSLHM